MLENEQRAAELAELPTGKGRSRGRRVLFSNTGRGRGRGGFGVAPPGRSFEVDLLKDMGYNRNRPKDYKGGDAVYQEVEE